MSILCHAQQEHDKRQSDSTYSTSLYTLAFTHQTLTVIRHSINFVHQDVRLGAAADQRQKVYRIGGWRDGGRSDIPEWEC